MSVAEAPARAQGARHSVFRRDVRAIALPLVALSDGALVAASFLFCYAARFELKWLSPANPPPFGPYLEASVLVALVWVAGMAFSGVYDAKRVGSRFDDAVLTAGGLLLGAGVTAGLASFYRSFSYSRLVFVYAFWGALAALTLWHLALRMLEHRGMRHGWGVRNTLVLGHNPASERVAARLDGNERRVVGAIAMPGEASHAGELERLGHLPDLARLVQALGVDEVVVAWPHANASVLSEAVREARMGRELAIHVVPDMLDAMTIHLEAVSLHGLPMLSLGSVKLRRVRYRLVKRAIDVALSGLGLVALSPLLALLALVVKLESPGPAFYAQERLGRDGHAFTIYKFRSMPVDAEPNGPVWTRTGDERATRLGALLRRYSLDELPQLWNVLKGDMSLVGPRPERPFFVERFSESVPRYADRHLVRSGLTGWAQVNGLRGDVDIGLRTRYDIQYVENWSVRLDLRILLMTVSAIFRRPGV